MLSKEAKSKMVQALMGKLRQGKRVAAETLYGKKPGSVGKHGYYGGVGGGLLGGALTAAMGKGAGQGIRVGRAAGALGGLVAGSKRAAKYQARKNRVNAALAGTGLSGLGLMALSKSKREK